MTIMYAHFVDKLGWLWLFGMTSITPKVSLKGCKVQISEDYGRSQLGSFLVCMSETYLPINQN